jgi:uroporphyrinogen decarboxylase
MKPDALYLVDDLGCTRGLLFSPDAWRSIFGPLFRRLGEFLHAHEVSFWLHCCGDCRELIPDLIDCGLQVLHPLQAEAGMDVRQLKPVYGGDLTFWGNIDVRKLSGTEAECEAEIREKLTTAKAGGGYMYHSDHSIPPEVTLDRYRRVLEWVERHGRY